MVVAFPWGPETPGLVVMSSVIPHDAKSTSCIVGPPWTGVNISVITPPFIWALATILVVITSPTWTVVKGPCIVIILPLPPAWSIWIVSFWK